MLTIVTLLVGDASALSAVFLIVRFHKAQFHVAAFAIATAAVTYLGGLCCAALRGLFFDDYMINAFQNLRHASSFARSQREALLKEYAEADRLCERAGDESRKNGSELGRMLALLGRRPGMMPLAMLTVLVEREGIMRDALLLIKRRRTLLRRLCSSCWPWRDSRIGRRRPSCLRVTTRRATTSEATDSRPSGAADAAGGVTSATFPGVARASLAVRGSSLAALEEHDLLRRDRIERASEHSVQQLYVQNGMEGTYLREKHRFVQNTLTLAQGLPLLRTLRFSWRPGIAPVDVAGILNANLLYSFTLGVTQLSFALFYTSSSGAAGSAGADALLSRGSHATDDDALVVFACAVLAAVGVVLGLGSSRFDLGRWLTHMQAASMDAAADREAVESRARGVHHHLVSSKQSEHQAYLRSFVGQHFERAEEFTKAPAGKPVGLQSLAEQLLLLERGYSNANHVYQQCTEGSLQLLLLYEEQPRDPTGAKDAQAIDALGHYRHMWAEQMTSKELEWRALTRSHELGSFRPTTIGAAQPRQRGRAAVQQVQVETPAPAPRLADEARAEDVILDA